MSRRSTGFTLIELMAVVILIALLYGFVAPNLGIGSRRALDGEAEGLRAGLELARQKAIATGTEHRVTLDLDAARFRLERFEIPAVAAPAEPVDPRAPLDLSAPRPPEGGFQPLPTRLGQGHRLPDGIRFGPIETEDGTADRGQVTVAFRQDGSASAARIVLENDDGDAIELEILPLADTVRVHAIQ